MLVLMQNMQSSQQQILSDELKKALNQSTPQEHDFNSLKKWLETLKLELRNFYKNCDDIEEVSSFYFYNINLFIKELFELYAKQPSSRLALCAVGSFGRELLCPKSDIDLFILQLHENLDSEPKQQIQSFLHNCWGCGLKISYSCHTHSSALEAATHDLFTRTSFSSAQLITGNSSLFKKFFSSFRQTCLIERREQLIADCLKDIEYRANKYANTIFLQEPHIKESPGGLRDLHNLLWICENPKPKFDLSELVKKGLIDQTTHLELRKDYLFLMRLRYLLHFETNSSNDRLTLQIQGVIAEQTDCPQENILRKIEALMHSYYRCAYRINRQTKLVFKKLTQPTSQNATEKTLLSEPLEKFFIQNQQIHTDHPYVFQKSPNTTLRLFQYCQRNLVTLDQSVIELFNLHLPTFTPNFLKNPTRLTLFLDLFKRPGEVSKILRMLHEMGILGKFIPEFGALTYLVQHEFFHLYTADEHTLRCIETLDHLLHTNTEKKSIYQELLLRTKDPLSLYMALLLHDCGRAKNAPKHDDASTVLSHQVCERLKIKGTQKQMLLFLVDHHLSFWAFSTKRNLQDPKTIQEFADIVRTTERLDALLLLTYADSKSTSQDSWTNWKESLLLQLYHQTKDYLKLESKSHFKKEQKDHIQKLKQDCLKYISDSLKENFQHHISMMPARYFHYRLPQEINAHYKTIEQFLVRKQHSADTFECATQWISFPEQGYSQFIIASYDCVCFLEKVCCALSSMNLNILGTDIYTRKDNAVLDLICVTNNQSKAITQHSIQDKIETLIYELNQQDDYDPNKYFQETPNFFKPKFSSIIPIPSRAYIDNHLDSKYTVIEIQSPDRSRLLHDILSILSQEKALVVHARASVQKGVVINTFYALNYQKRKILDKPTIQRLEYKLNDLVH